MKVLRLTKDRDGDVWEVPKESLTDAEAVGRYGEPAAARSLVLLSEPSNPGLLFLIKYLEVPQWPYYTELRL